LWRRSLLFFVSHYLSLHVNKILAASCVSSLDACRIFPVTYPDNNIARQAYHNQYDLTSTRVHPALIFPLFGLLIALGQGARGIDKYPRSV